MSGLSYPVVSISGLPGSGTTTAAHLLIGETGLEYVNTGKIFREMAQENGMSLNDFGKYAAQNPEVDQELDRRQMARAAQGGIVLEGRLAGHMVTREGLDALTVWLDAPIEVRVARVAGREEVSLAEAMRLSREREDDERDRYLDIYGLDLYDTSFYDLVIDSGTLSPTEILEAILQRLT